MTSSRFFSVLQLVLIMALSLGWNHASDYKSDRCLLFSSLFSVFLRAHQSRERQLIMISIKTYNLMLPLPAISNRVQIFLGICPIDIFFYFSTKKTESWISILWGTFRISQKQLFKRYNCFKTSFTIATVQLHHTS